MRTHSPTHKAYSELQQAYDHFNQALFMGTLPPCLFTLQRQKKTFGFFSQSRFGTRAGQTTDEIAINPEYFAVVPAMEVLQTLVHEMVHLWQAHHGQPSRACYHNKEWAEKMEAIGLMPSSTGMPGGKKVGQHMADYLVPGGPFALAAQQLLDDGFEITWLDRYPALPPEKPQQQGGEKAELCHATTPLAQASLPQGAPALDHPGVVVQLKNGASGQRMKYTCPICGINAWGRPGLKLVCGDCQIVLVTLPFPVNTALN